MHIDSANLHFDRAAMRTDHGGVETLIHVELRHRYEVFEASRHRAPLGVHHPEHRIAIADVLYQDAHSDEIVDVREVASSNNHFLVNRVIVLGSACHGGLHLAALQVCINKIHDRREVLISRRRTLTDQMNDLLEHLGIQGRESEILKLPLDRIHAEAVCQRRVDLQCLSRLLLLLLFRHVPNSAHVVQAITELDDQDANIPRHGNNHLAHGLRRTRFTVGDLVQLGDAIDQGGDLFTKVFSKRLKRIAAVFNGVVQQSRGQRGCRHTEIRKNRGDCKGVGDVRLP